MSNGSDIISSMPIDMSAIREAFQRRMGQGGAGQPAGQPMGGAMPGAMPMPGMGESMSGPGMDQLKQSKPGEAELILKALIQRLRQLPPEGGTNVATA